MEEKLLQILKLVNTLDEKQDKLYADVEYCADDKRQLTISIRRKADYSYLEKCSIMLLSNPVTRLDAIIKLLEEYINGTTKDYKNSD